MLAPSVKIILHEGIFFPLRTRLLVEGLKLLRLTRSSSISFVEFPNLSQFMHLISLMQSLINIVRKLQALIGC